MTTLLQEAFDEVAKLDPAEQERWARWILEGLQDERDWPEGETGFDALAREALKEHREGRTEPLEDLLAEDIE